jgi:hypothetical protein
MSHPVPLLDLLYEALNSESGIVVETNSPERLRAKLYVEKKKDSDFECLSFSISRTSPESELLIVKTSKSRSAEGDA